MVRDLSTFTTEKMYVIQNVTIALTMSSPDVINANSVDEIIKLRQSVNCNELHVEKHHLMATITPSTKKLHICPQAITCVMDILAP